MVISSRVKQREIDCYIYMGILKAPILKPSPILEFLNYCDLIVIERIPEDFAQFNDCIVVGECLMRSLTASPLTKSRLVEFREKVGVVACIVISIKKLVNFPILGH